MTRCGARPSAQARLVGLGVSFVLSVGVGLGVPAPAFGADAEPVQEAVAPAVQEAVAPAVQDAVAPAVQDAVAPAVQEAVAPEVQEAVAPEVAEGSHPEGAESDAAQAASTATMPGDATEDVTDTPAADSDGNGPEATQAAEDKGAVEPVVTEEPMATAQAARATEQSPAAAAAEPAKPKAVTYSNMFRLYNPNSGEHFYTASQEEAKNVVEAGWRWEGIGWIAPSEGAEVYRLYSGTDHFYTLSKDEKDHLVSVGWKYEGVGWHSEGEDGLPLYRQFNPNVDPSASYNNSGSHNYTLSKRENDHLVTLGWRAEGIGWYGSNRPAEAIKGFWVETAAWTGSAKQRYWIASDATVAKSRYIGPAEGTGYSYNVYATSTGAMLRDDATRIDGVLTAANKDGRLMPITSRISLNVPYTNQYDEGAPMGCEGAGLYMALRAKGYIPNMTFRQFMGTMPYAKDGNPYHGFIGSPWPGYDPYEYNGMLMGGVARWGANYAAVEDLTGCGEGTLVAELAQGNPVVVWVSPRFKTIYPRNEWYGKSASTWHVMTLMGYNPTTREFQVSDPANSKRQYWVGWNTYTRVWEVLRGAVVVR